MSRLLVVEDDKAYRQFLSIALDMAGYRVHAAGSGAEAIETLQTVSPDLVLLDLSMPTVTGWMSSIICAIRPRSNIFRS